MRVKKIIFDALFQYLRRDKSFIELLLKIENSNDLANGLKP